MFYFQVSRVTRSHTRRGWQVIQTTWLCTLLPTIPLETYVVAFCFYRISRAQDHPKSQTEPIELASCPFVISNPTYGDLNISRENHQKTIFGQEWWVRPVISSRCRSLTSNPQSFLFQAPRNLKLLQNQGRGLYLGSKTSLRVPLLVQSHVQASANHSTEVWVFPLCTNPY